MSRNANQESEGLPRPEVTDSHASEFDDSVLRRVLHVELPPRLPGPGERFGGPEGRRYEVLEQVGRGAMGQVFRARDEVLHREVALKFLAPRTGLSEEALREARAVARLDHENIVRIFDVSEWCATPGGARVPFLVMEYLEGESLAALLRRHRPGLKLEDRFPEVVEARPEVLAYHHAEAGAPEWALPYQVRAGLLASQRSSLQEAVSHYTRALELLRGLPHAERLVHEELRILLALGPPLTHLRGYRSPEAERTYARARKLLHRVGDALPELDLSPWGPFTYCLARGEFRQGHELAGLLVELGERHHDRVLLMLGHRMRAIGFASWGRMREALDALECAMACARFELEQHRRIAARHGADPWTTALAYAAFIHSVRGQPEEAWRYSRGALEMATHIGHAQTQAYVLTYLAMGSQLRHEPEPTLKWAEQLQALANERSFWIWGSWATLFEGWARSQLGQPRVGVELIERELASWKERGIRLGVPHGLGLLAEIHLKLGQFEEGLAAVHEARAEQSATGERTYEAELYRVEGELLRATGRDRKARSRFIHAIETAHKQDAGLFELRATSSLCRLLRDTGRLEVARLVLQRARTRFGEHLDSPDHREASALMKELLECAYQGRCDSSALHR